MLPRSAVIESIAEGLVIACPPALPAPPWWSPIAPAGAAGASCSTRALHELRRPLQALVLQASASATPARGRDQLAQALEALEGIDRQVNGGTPPLHAIADPRALAADAVRRWRGPAALEGRSIAFAWRAQRLPAALRRGGDRAGAGQPDRQLARAWQRPDPDRGVRARREAAADGRRRGRRRSRQTPPDRRPKAGVHRRRQDGRRGHGLRIVAEVAAAHGGRFAACAHAEGASAVLELPLTAASERDAA